MKSPESLVTKHVLQGVPEDKRQTLFLYFLPFLFSVELRSFYFKVTLMNFSDPSGLEAFVRFSHFATNATLYVICFSVQQDYSS